MKYLIFVLLLFGLIFFVELSAEKNSTVVKLPAPVMGFW